MRLFVALRPSAAALEHLDAAVSPFRETRSDLRWTKAPSWHVTLAFFGEVAEAREPELERRLARAAARHAGAALAFRGAGAFRRPAAATVLWTGVDGPIPQLAALAASCAAAGRRIGLDVDDRPYRPHLTLARAKSPRPVDVRPLVEELADYAGPSWAASEIELVCSRLGPDNSYETVGRWALADREGNSAPSNEIPS